MKPYWESRDVNDMDATYKLGPWVIKKNINDMGWLIVIRRIIRETI